MASPLHSFAPTKPKESDNDRRGILRNATANDKPNEIEPMPITQRSTEKPMRTLQDVQDRTVKKCIEKYGRSASVQSRKSGDNNKKDNEDVTKEPLGRHQMQPTIVAFGRTTKLEDTLKSVKPVVHRAPIGSTKDITDLRNIVEHQNQIIQNQQEQINQLFDILKTHDEKYLYLLESDGKLWSRLNSLSRNASTLNVSQNGIYLPKAPDKEEVPVSTISKPKPVPCDSIAIKKQKEPAEHQLVPVAAKPIHESPSLSDIKRFIMKHPEQVKDVAKMVKKVSKDSDSDEERRTKKHHRQKEQPEVSSVLEKITVERKVYNHRRPPHHLTSTIDDSLRELGMAGMYTPPRDANRNHHHQHQRPAPSTPTICEVTSSSESDGEASAHLPPTPVRQRQHKNDRHRHQPMSSIQATHMPDKFSDDNLFDSDTHASPEPDENRRPRRVADRLRNNARRH